jgi:hypothetical protein
VFSSAGRTDVEVEIQDGCEGYWLSGHVGERVTNSFIHSLTSYILMNQWDSVNSDGEEVPLVPYQRVTSGSEMVVGESTVTVPGKYVFKWDNSFSWMSSKSLTYTIERRDPSTI